jgi:hypothetical protein
MFSRIVEHHANSSVCQPLACHQPKAAKWRRRRSAPCLPPEPFSFETAQIDGSHSSSPGRHLAGVGLGLGWGGTGSDQLARNGVVATLDRRRRRGPRVAAQAAVESLDELADGIA